MSFIDAPPVLTQLRTQLLLCQSLISLGITSDRIHYPKASPVGDDADTMPFLIVAELSQKRTRYAEGAVPLISGQLAVTIYADEAAIPTIGKMETLGRQVIFELGSQFYGLLIRDGDVALSSDLSPGQRAEEENTSQAAFRTITLNLNYGLSR